MELRVRARICASRAEAGIAGYGSQVPRRKRCRVAPQRGARGLSFPMTVTQAASQVDAALESDDATRIENLQSELDSLNNEACPL
jgi:hypothetical protein